MGSAVVFGGGRNLYASELAHGEKIAYLLTVQYAGATFRWSFPGARTVYFEDGTSARYSAMDAADAVQSFDFDSDSPADLTVSFDGLVFPASIDLPLLVAQGHALERGTGELAAIVDEDDKRFEDRHVILRGFIRDPIYGAPELARNAVSFSLESNSWTDNALFPPASAIITDGTILDHEGDPYTILDSAVGLVRPWVFGQPGAYYSYSGGITQVVKGTPAVLLFDAAGFINVGVLAIAGHIVAPDGVDPTVDPWLYLNDTTTGGTLGPYIPIIASDYIDTQRITLVAVLGLSVADPDLNHEYWVRSWAPIDNALPGRDIGTYGALPSITDPDRPMVEAGEVLQYMLEQSTLEVDMGRCATATALLRGYHVGGYIDERVSPIAWIQDNLLPILPVSLGSGPKGVYPIVWRFDASQADAVARVIEGPAWRRVSGIETDNGDLLNEFTLRYVSDGGDFKRTLTISGALPSPPARDPLTESQGLLVRPDIYAHRSYIDAGNVVYSGSLDTEIVWLDEVASRIASWKIRAKAFPRKTVTYESGFSWAWLEPGDVVVLEDSNGVYIEQVAIVSQKTWDVTGLRFQLLFVGSPIRTAVVAPEVVEAGHLSDSDTLLLLKMEDVGTFIDSSSYARPITTHGSVAQGPLGAKYGVGGATFGGTMSDYLSIPDSVDFQLGTGDFTVEGWAKTSNASIYQNVFWMGNANTETKRFLIYIDGPNAGLRWFWKDGSPIVNNYGSNAVVSTDVWFHWAVQRQGGNAFVHVNGVLVDTYIGMGSHSMFDWTADIRIGEQDLSTGEYPFVGSMDEIRFSKVARYGAANFVP